ncbi:hypothetical protein LTR37_002662 [Vermiconidia calcicola]|uniref:Uncharacterized protein n=1 Tax=Vermiconidia calcicola TaxID=1690605 RepID=A0ACC3NSB5_9PEZI|nr:hypothetical protein LTR37_002662 [Vermiconidia calcicola]
MEESEYFHATLYQFNTVSRNEIIKRFNHAVNNVSAKCWYNTDLQWEVFCLACPQAIGGDADGALATTVSDYIAEELDQADYEERPANVRQFAQSNLDEDGLFHVQGAARLQPTDPTSSSNVPPSTATAKAKAPTLHHVASKANSGSTLMLLNLRGLPQGFLERTLTPFAFFKKTIELSSTIRAVRWDSSAEDYVFNGRHGAALSNGDQPEPTIIKTTHFLPMYDQRSHRNTPDQRPKSEVTQVWRFAGDKTTPTVRQFLEGMARTEPDVPEQMPEMPSDAKEFREHSIPHAITTARVRVPRLIGSNSDADAEDSDECMSDPARKGLFKQLMAAQRKSEDRPADHDRNSLSDYSDDGEDNPIINKFAKNKAPASMPPPPLPTERSLPDVISSHASQGERSQLEASDTSTPATNATKQGTSSYVHAEGIPTYSRMYASVDTVGLTSIAANQAQWELENMSPRRNKPNRSGITRRQPTEASFPLSPLPTSGSSAAMSMSTGPELRRMQRPPTPASLVSSAAASTTIRNWAGVQHNMEPWANKVPPRTLPEARLIDDSAPLANTTMRLPPGLGPPPDSELRGCPPQISGNVYYGSATANATNAQTTGILIDLTSDENTEHTVNLPKSTPHRRLQPAILPSSNVQGAETLVHDRLDKDYIYERLQQPTEGRTVKRYTMRQKAAKKNKKKNGKAAASAVNLPKPDPIPPPKPSVKQDRPTTSSGTEISTPNALSSKGNQQASNGGVQQSSAQPRADISVPNSRVGAFLQQLAAGYDLRHTKIEARFGTTLVRQADNKDFLKGVLDKDAVEKKLHGAGDALQTDFLPRMTTSTTDAQYMLALIPGSDVTAKVKYEIHVKNSEGSLRIIKFDQAARDHFEVLLADTTVGTLYIHYPIRVFDAQVTVDKPCTDENLIEAAGQFVSSMQTIEHEQALWAWQAWIPPNSFSVEKVLAKRIFTKTSLTNAIDLQVTEVQDLVLEPVAASARYNFRAICYPPGAMVEHQRLWWECRLRLHDATDASAVDGLADAVDEIVGKIDGVGFANEGPWKRAEIEEAAGNTTQPEWFW